MARKRQEHEESIQEECFKNIKRIREREASLATTKAAHDTQSQAEQESQNAEEGFQQLAQMNLDLEQLIRNVYAKI